MVNIDKLVQEITDRLLENLHQESMAKKVYVIGQVENESHLLQEGYKIVDQEDSADYLIVTSLSRDSLLRVASLCPTSKEESILLSALLEGKPVFVWSACLQLAHYQKKAKSLLYREMLEQKRKLDNYGVQFYEKETLMALLKKKQQLKKAELQGDQKLNKKVSKKKNLITEAKLKNLQLRAGQFFRLEEDMIITDLARDYLKRHHIIIEE
ncbi:ethanolamine utilization protein [Streptococcus catagoni]|uniref:ethanolamine utilization protein n=1 Tax=Streptococcus catagoni TaxID=2654874 RepID=UPI00140C6EB5|nr:ethanolamine utilization protein [Streptococcus catagoni]